MRSYDWRMPEEKYRTVIDHLADVIYTYFDEYKEQAVAEGLNPRNIVVVQNLIVDVLDHYYFERQEYFEDMVSGSFFADRGIERGEYFLMTCHRRENVEDPEVLDSILELPRHVPKPVYFTASYRTQKNLVRFGLAGARERDRRRPDRLRRAPRAPGELPRGDHRLRHDRRGDGRARRPVAPDPARDRAPAGLRLRLEREVRPEPPGGLSGRRARAQARGAARADLGARPRRREGVGSHQSRTSCAGFAEDDFRGHVPETHHLRKHVERSYREDGLPEPGLMESLGVVIPMFDEEARRLGDASPRSSASSTGSSARRA